MIKRKSWKEFRKTGLLLIVNQILNIFGWAIAFSFDDKDNLKEIYPARVKFRGFDEKSTNMSDNIKDFEIDPSRMDSIEIGAVFDNRMMAIIFIVAIVLIISCYF